jgi:hypothetical protein
MNRAILPLKKVGLGNLAENSENAVAARREIVRTATPLKKGSFVNSWAASTAFKQGWGENNRHACLSSETQRWGSRFCCDSDGGQLGHASFNRTSIHNAIACPLGPAGQFGWPKPACPHPTRLPVQTDLADCQLLPVGTIPCSESGGES